MAVDCLDFLAKMLGVDTLLYLHTTYFACSSVNCHEQHKYTFFYEIYEVTMKSVECKSMYYGDS
jgi:hypothetical protein